MYNYQLLVALHLLAFTALVLLNLHDYAPLPPNAVPLRPDERLYVLIPARNEAANIAECVDGLLKQEWTNFTLLVLDDASTDGTDTIVAAIADRDARVRLLRGQPLEAGWAGKVWACRQLGEAALADGADWLLFLDADTRVQPSLLGPALAFAQRTEAGMVSTFPYQICGTWAERTVLPMLHFLITTFLPIRLIWQTPFVALVAACGQFELFSAPAYRATGGHGSLPGSFHDGLQLARRVKASGRTVRLVDGSRQISCHMYDGARMVWNGFTRNAYEGLGGFVPLLAMTVLQTVLFLLPFGFALAALGMALTGRGWPAWSGWVGLQIGLIGLIRVLQARRFGHGASVWLHPLSVTVLVAIQWASFWKSLRKTPIAWKGRTYG